MPGSGNAGTQRPTRPEDIVSLWRVSDPQISPDDKRIAYLASELPTAEGRGYLVFLPSFRGSAGYGMAWMSASVRNWGAGPLSDVLSGVDHLVRQGEADPRRLFLGGGSYGGYLTGWAMTHTDRFRGTIQ